MSCVTSFVSLETKENILNESNQKRTTRLRILTSCHADVRLTIMSALEVGDFFALP